MGAVQSNTIKCQLCGQEWIADDQDRDEIMFLHLVFHHPVDVIESPKFRRKLGTTMFDLGAKLADYLKGAMNEGKSKGS